MEDCRVGGPGQRPGSSCARAPAAPRQSLDPARCLRPVCSLVLPASRFSNSPRASSRERSHRHVENRCDLKSRPGDLIQTRRAIVRRSSALQSRDPHEQGLDTYHDGPTRSNLGAGARVRFIGPGPRLCGGRARENRRFTTTDRSAELSKAGLPRSLLLLHTDTGSLSILQVAHRSRGLGTRAPRARRLARSPRATRESLSLLRASFSLRYPGLGMMIERQVTL